MEYDAMSFKIGIAMGHISRAKKSAKEPEVEPVKESEPAEEEEVQ